MITPCITSGTNRFNHGGPTLTYCDKVIEDEPRLIVLNEFSYADRAQWANRPVCVRCAAAINRKELRSHIDGVMRMPMVKP